MVSANIAAVPGVSPVPAIRPSVKLPAWLEVAKPRLIPLLLASTLGGMAVSGEGWLDASTIFCTLVGGALASAAAGVLNCLWEQDLDGRMQRTSRRALPSGRLAQRQAFGLAIALTVLSVVVLVLGVNALAASLALLGLCSYVLLYTALLKPRTRQNIVVGGVAGAIPPLVGAAAATGHLGWASWWLFALIMVWTPAHFWSLALLLKEDYRSVGIPMLPVVKGVVVTTRAIWHYSIATVVLSLLGIWAVPGGEILYGLLVLPFNGRLLQLAASLRQEPTDPQRAKAMFRWSIFYLFGICLLLLMAHSPQAALVSWQGITPALLGLPTLGG
ncbi:heme o synthase [Cyanobium sp. WAJ14-Wanaka]|uniref:heme o synthase n=1 Tax=Cyanobium sp. WAJ14-Wanaka TaxID=2823725 RepID=UPI0020CBAC58|nr:heme o synthase [Cyanobium sp. WAJ14-Wanaka]MCP9774144.1 heme o synthase [Cyanobium sp. WAJ14-Wanaka]